MIPRLLLPLLLAAAACNGAAPAASPPAAPQPPAGDPVAEPLNSPVQRLFGAGAGLAVGRAQIRARLGPPAAVEVATRPNRHAAVIDSLIRWRYPGLTLEIVRSGYNGPELLTSVTSIGGTLHLPLGIGVGRSTADRLAALLGPPQHTRTRGDTVVLTYSPATEGADEYDLQLRRDTLRRVRWDFHVD